MAQEGDGSKIKEDWADTLRGDKMFVGLCGAAGSGKSTVAKYLVERHDFERIPFAKVLKDMTRAFGLTHAQVYGDEKEMPVTIAGKVRTWTPRQFMQWLGTEFGRQSLGEDIWVDIWMDHAKAFKRVVVDDVRFPNEVDAVHQLGGKVILIDRGLQWSTGSHESEHWHKLAWDRGIANGGSVDDLCRSVEAVLWPAWPLETATA